MAIQTALQQSLELAKKAQQEALKAQQQQAQLGHQNVVAQQNQGYEQTVSQYNKAYTDAQSQYERAYQQALSEYSSRGQNVERQAEDVAKQAYVQKMQQQRVAPNILQASGLSGQGYSESVLGKISSSYQQTWSDIMQEKNANLGELERMKGLAGVEKNFGLSQAESEYKFGLSMAEAEKQSVLTQAQRELQASLIGLQGQYQSNVLSLESQYQRDLANYLSSLRTSGGGGGGGDSTTKRSTLSQVEAGLNNIQFNPRAGGDWQQPIVNYLQSYVDKGVISKDEANTLFNRWATNVNRSYQPTTQPRAGEKTQAGQNVADYNEYSSNLDKTKKTTKTISTKADSRFQQMR